MAIKGSLTKCGYDRHRLLSGELPRGRLKIGDFGAEHGVSLSVVVREAGDLNRRAESEPSQPQRGFAAEVVQVPVHILHERRPASFALEHQSTCGASVAAPRVNAD